MSILGFGILLLVFFMLFVMGTPLVHYLKREQKWTKAGRTRDAWYN